jgi:hypothetical protein
MLRWMTGAIFRGPTNTNKISRDGGNKSANERHATTAFNSRDDAQYVSAFLDKSLADGLKSLFAPISVPFCRDWVIFQLVESPNSRPPLG